MTPRHSILVITYRQEAMIRECLDSIVNQSIPPYEIVIADDCSPDNTWAIIQDYSAKYPNLVKAYQNEQNLGVFGNFNQLIKKATGDLVNIVAGDDLLPEGTLEKYTRFIQQHNLNCNDSFVIYTNSIVLKPDGKQVFKNNQQNFRPSMFEVACLHCMWSWDTGMSIGLFKRIQEGIRTDLGYQADLLWHLNKIEKTDTNYFLDAVGYIYRSNVGVSVATKHTTHLESKQQIIAEIYRQFPNSITPKIKRFFTFDKSWMIYNANPSLGTYLNFIKHYISFGSFPPGNIHHHPLKVLPPIWAKRLIKKLIGRNY